MKTFITALLIIAAGNAQSQTLISLFKFDSNPVTTDGLEAGQNTEIRILNTMGNLVLERNNVTENRNMLDISGLNSGTYIVEVIADGHATRSMLVKN